MVHFYTVLGREWNGQMHRRCPGDAFACGETYPSLSKVAFAIGAGQILPTHA
jgi:hypothetical protein